MILTAYEKGSDGRTRPVETRPIKDGERYSASRDGVKYESVTCVKMLGDTLGFVKDGLPGLTIASTYYVDVIEV